MGTALKTTARKACHDAADLMESAGDFAQHAYAKNNGSQECYCITGALGKVIFNASGAVAAIGASINSKDSRFHVMSEAFKLILEANDIERSAIVDDTLTGYAGDLFTWNDMQDRTVEEVIQALRNV